VVQEQQDEATTSPPVGNHTQRTGTLAISSCQPIFRTVSCAEEVIHHQTATYERVPHSLPQAPNCRALADHRAPSWPHPVRPPKIQVNVDLDDPLMPTRTPRDDMSLQILALGGP
jgi:hypothetical protein